MKEIRMDTYKNSGYAPSPKKVGSEHYKVLLEDYEFYMPVQQLQNIANYHNDGMKLEDIAAKVRRNPIEVMMAILDQFTEGNITRPFAYR